jgi:hypothetical protein
MHLKIGIFTYRFDTKANFPAVALHRTYIIRSRLSVYGLRLSREAISAISTPFSPEVRPFSLHWTQGTSFPAIAHHPHPRKKHSRAGVITPEDTLRPIVFPAAEAKIPLPVYGNKCYTLAIRAIFSVFFLAISCAAAYYNFYKK